MPNGVAPSPPAGLQFLLGTERIGSEPTRGVQGRVGRIEAVVPRARRLRDVQHRPEHRLCGRPEDVAPRAGVELADGWRGAIGGCGADLAGASDLDGRVGRRVVEGRGRDDVAVVLDVELEQLADRPEVGLALRPTGVLLRRAQRRQQDGEQQRDDADDGEHLDDGETSGCGALVHAGVRFVAGSAGFQRRAARPQILPTAPAGQRPHCARTRRLDKWIAARARAPQPRARVGFLGPISPSPSS